MVFSSLVFLYIFLTATILIYYLLPRRARNAFLLAANLVFYFCGEPVYIVLMVFSILANYVFGRLMASAKEEKGRKRALVAAPDTISDLGACAEGAEPLDPAPYRHHFTDLS